MPSRSPSGERMQWPEPANTEQRKAPSRPTKGGAMRTRIALVAIIPVALITVSTLTQTATAQAARAVPTSSSSDDQIDRRSPCRPPDWRPTVVVRRAGTSTSPGRSNFCRASCTMPSPPVARIPTPAPPPAADRGRPGPGPPPPVAAPHAGPVDTVTPGQRAAWERVAMCEEGGNWAANGSAFSGGLGISRANWAAYGGRQFAPEGPWPPRTSRSWWPSASSPARRISTAAAAGSRGRYAMPAAPRPQSGQLPATLIGTAVVRTVLMDSSSAPYATASLDRRGSCLRGPADGGPPRCLRRCRYSNGRWLPSLGTQTQ